MRSKTSELINETQGYIDKYLVALESVAEILPKLKEYTKKTINKTFFELYFTMKDEKGEIRKDWKGNLYTYYKFSDPVYSFEKGKRLYLSNGEKVSDILTPDRLELIKKLEEYKETTENYIVSLKKKIEKLKAFNEDDFVNDLKGLYLKYDKPTNWRELLEDNFYFHDLIQAE